jgi:hypothetical protein
VSSAASNVQSVADVYKLVAPDGRPIVVTRELFEALEEMTRRRASGSVTMEFREGRVAGVRQVVEKRYK